MTIELCPSVLEQVREARRQTLSAMIDVERARLELPTIANIERTQLQLAWQHLEAAAASLNNILDIRG